VNANPWLMEQVVKNRMDDLRRQADVDHLAAAGRSGVRPARVRWSQQLGGVLIRAGHRLAGPETESPIVPVTTDARGLGAGC